MSDRETVHQGNVFGQLFVWEMSVWVTSIWGTTHRRTVRWVTSIWGTTHRRTVRQGHVRRGNVHRGTVLEPHLGYEKVLNVPPIAYRVNLLNRFQL